MDFSLLAVSLACFAVYFTLLWRSWVRVKRVELDGAVLNFAGAMTTGIIGGILLVWSLPLN